MGMTWIGSIARPSGRWRIGARRHAAGQLGSPKVGGLGQWHGNVGVGGNLPSAAVVRMSCPARARGLMVVRALAL